MLNKVKIGMVGLGGFGVHRRFKLRQSQAFDLVAGVDPSDEAFAKAQQSEGRPLRRYATVEELVADPEVEAVVISTPAHLHVEQAWAVAKAGKAIYCEKPLGPDLEACRELVEYCLKEGIPHGHGFSARYYPVWQEVRRILDSGELGQILSISAATMHTGGLAHPPDNWRFLASRNPGGPIFQCGIHKLDTLRFLFGEGKWHAGLVNRTVTESPTDDAYILLGTFGGIPTTLHCHYVACYRHAVEIYGTKGDLFITEHPTKLEMKKTDLNADFEPVVDLTDTIPASTSDLDALRDFALAVRERRQPLMDGREGLKGLELIFEAEAIAKEISSRQAAPC